MSGMVNDQPAPIPGERVVGLQVIRDITERMEFGHQKYGMFLETENGRDPLWDAYMEAVDLVMYLRQELMKREAQV
jgi:hypothetical protein